MKLRKTMFLLTVVSIALLTIEWVLARQNEAPADPHREHIVRLIEHYNPGLPQTERDRLVDNIFAQSERLKLPAHFEIEGQPIYRPYLVAAFIKTESAFHRYAVSVADARGYMQIKPDTVAWLDSVNGTNTSAPHIFTTETNLARGVEYIAYLSTEFDSMREVSLAYNAGPGSLRKGRYVEEYWESIRDTYLRLQKGELPDKQWDYDVQFADHYDI